MELDWQTKHFQASHNAGQYKLCPCVSQKVSSWATVLIANIYTWTKICHESWLIRHAGLLRRARLKTKYKLRTQIRTQLRHVWCWHACRDAQQRSFILRVIWLAFDVVANVNGGGKCTCICVHGPKHSRGSRIQNIGNSVEEACTKGCFWYSFSRWAGVFTTVMMVLRKYIAFPNEPHNTKKVFQSYMPCHVGRLVQ